MAHRHPLKDIAFLTEFAAFCRGKGEEGYCYTDPGNCALAQFARERFPDATSLPCGVRKASVFGDRPDEHWNPTYGSDLHDALCAHGAAARFSALADRLEALLVDAPATVSA
jgi:hypothetical protein